MANSYYSNEPSFTWKPSSNGNNNKPSGNTSSNKPSGVGGSQSSYKPSGGNQSGGSTSFGGNDWQWNASTGRFESASQNQWVNNSGSGMISGGQDGTNKEPINVGGSTWLYNPSTGQYEPTGMTQTGSGSWTTGGGYNNNYNNNNDYLSEYEQMQQAQLEAQKKRLEALLGQIDGKRPEVQAQAEEMARQAYINQMLGGQQAKEQMAASGLGNTGYSESSQLGLQTAYQQALNGINQNKTNALTSLDNAKIQAQASGNADLAGIEAQYSQMMAQLKQQMEQEAYNRQLQAQQMALQQDTTNWNQQLQSQQFGMQQDESNWNRQMAMAQLYQQMAGDEYSREADRNKQLFSAGIWSPDVAQWYGMSLEDMYNSLGGYNSQQAQMEAAYNNMVKPKTRSGVSVRSGSNNENGYPPLDDVVAPKVVADPVAEAAAFAQLQGKFKSLSGPAYGQYVLGGLQEAGSAMMPQGYAQYYQQVAGVPQGDRAMAIAKLINNGVSPTVIAGLVEAFGIMT